MGAYFGNGGENLLGKDSPNAWGSFANSSGEWSGGKSGIDWGGTFSSLFEKAAKNRFSDNDPYGKGSTGFGGGGWGSQNSVDIGGGNTVVTTGGGSPMYIPGQRGGGGFGGALGTLAGIGASFIPGLGPGIAAAMPSIGGSVGSFFG